MLSGLQPCLHYSYHNRNYERTEPFIGKRVSQIQPQSSTFTYFINLERTNGEVNLNRIF